MNDPSLGETLREMRAEMRRAIAALERRKAKLAYTVEETADALGIGRTKVFEAIATGRLRARKFGRRTLILVEDADAFLASLDEV